MKITTTGRCSTGSGTETLTMTGGAGFDPLLELLDEVLVLDDDGDADDEVEAVADATAVGLEPTVGEGDALPGLVGAGVDVGVWEVAVCEVCGSDVAPVEDFPPGTPLDGECVDFADGDW